MNPTLMVFAFAGALAFAGSLLGATDLLGPDWLRLVVVVVTWGVFALALAYSFLPGLELPWRVQRRLRGSLGRAVALTIDDGPHPESTPAILAVLAAARVRATFFLVGQAVERYPALVHRIVAEGHVVGNHTQRHRLLIFRTSPQLSDEIVGCQKVLAGAGVVARLFRPPHGFKPVGLHRLLRREHLRLVAWQGAIRDTDAPGVDTIVRRALRLAAPGRILLLHDHPSCQGQTALALPAIIAGYRARGFDFVALDGEG